jgi:hypothetical protein
MIQPMDDDSLPEPAEDDDATSPPEVGVAAPAETSEAAKPRGVGRPKGKVGKPPPKEPEFENIDDASLCWLEVIEKVKKLNRSIDQLKVRVVRVEPPPKGQVGHAFEARLALGDQSTIPSDALIDIVDKYYHTPYWWSQHESEYWIQWIWKSNGHLFCQATLRRPSRETIGQSRTAEWGLRGDPGNLGALPPLPPAPPPFPSYGQSPPTPPQPPPIPYGYPPQYPQAQYPQAASPRDPEIEHLKSEMREIKDLLRAAAGPAPVTAPAPVPPPPPPESIQVQMARAFAQTLVDLGVVHGNRAGVGAPAAAPAPPPPTVVQQASTGLEAIEALAGILDRTIRVGKKLGNIGREEEETEPEPEPGDMPEGEEKRLGIVDVGGSWKDGRPFKGAINPKTGEFRLDLQGLAGTVAGNPIIAEGFMDFMGAIREKMMKPENVGVGQPQPPQQPQIQVRQMRPPLSPPREEQKEVEEQPWQI